MAMYYDKVSGEKLPNGDVSQFMTAMNKELSSLKEKGVNEGLTLGDKAHFLAVAKNLTGAIEYYTKLWGSQISAVENFKVDFTDLGLIVSSQKGATTSEISSDIFDELSLDEIKRAAKVTEKSLKDLYKNELFGDTKADNLIKKYKKITGNKASSVAIKVLK